MAWTTVATIIIVALVVLAIGWCGWCWWCGSSEAFNQGSSEGITVILAHASFCGHCVSYKATGVFPGKFTERLKKEGLENEILVREVLYEADPDGEIEKYHITRFPTIIAVSNKSGEVISTLDSDVYDRSSVDSLMSFAKHALKAK